MKKAFTLSEILITLGIIGVVAAMTMPLIVQKVDEIVMVNRLKKIYSVLSQAMLYSVAKNGDISSLSVKNNSLSSINNWYTNALKPQLKITKECVDTEGCWAKGVKILNGGNPEYGRDGVGIGEDIIVFQTSDGYSVNIDAYDYSADGRFGVKFKQNGSDFLAVFVDINGYNNPNIVGKDIFMFIFSPDVGFVPAGKHESDDVVNNNCSKKSTSNLAGYYCFEKLIRNNWHVDKNFYD